MERIIPPINPQDQGPAVLNLQNAMLSVVHKRNLTLDNRSPNQWNESLSDEKRTQTFGNETQALLAALVASLNLSPVPVEFVNAQVAEALNQILEGLGAFNGATPGRVPESTGFIVRGRVFRPDSSPWAGVTVTAFDKDLRGEQQLNDTPAKTDAEGKFEVPYTSEQFSTGDIANPELAADLFFEIRDQERKIEKLRVTRVPSDSESLKPAVSIGERQIIFNARKTEVVEIRTDAVDGEAPRWPSEYELLLAAITPVLGALSLAELTSDDVAFLTGETEQDAVHLSFLAEAAKRARQTDLQTEVFYGLFREGLPTELPALLAEGPDKIREALKAAISDNIIPIAIDANLRGILVRFRELIVEQAFQTPEEGRFSLSSLLALSMPDQDRQRKFLVAYYAHEGTIQDFWTVTATRDLGFEKPQIQDLQFNLQLGALTQQHVPLISAVRKDQRGFKSPQELAVLEKEDWLKFIAGTTDTKVGIPPGIPGADGQKENNYVEDIIGTLQGTFPTQFAAHVAAQTTDTDMAKAKDLLAKFFARATNFDEPEKNFDFRTTPVNSYLRQHGDTAFEGVSEAERLAATTQLKRMGRTFQMSSGREQMKALIESGFDSAQRITRLSQGDFVDSMKDKLGGEEAARDVYAKADHISATVQHLFANVWSEARDVMPFVMRSPEQNEASQR